MKFGKELASQMVPEWKNAYMNYSSLKAVLKDILIFHTNQAPSSEGHTPPRIGRNSPKKRLALHRAFSGLTGHHHLKGGTSFKNEEEVILVSAVERDENLESYETMFLRPSDHGGDKEVLFFKMLDDEFNKVVGFYRQKVQEVKAEAEELDKQMNALVALRVKLDMPSIGRGFDCKGQQREVVQEVEMMSEGRKDLDIDPFQAGFLDVLHHVKINVEPETPASTLRNGVTSSISDLSFSKEELRKAQGQLRQALVKFYQQLRVLKNYCFLNTLAFSKIMKKYDKITSWNASKSYLKMVDKSYLGRSDEVNKLIERVEATFIMHFANGNRRKGMEGLKPKHKQDRHRTTFFLGLFTGCSMALVVAIIISIHARNLLNHQGRGKYMDTIFPLYSLFGYIILHMLMYGAGTYFWKRFSVNYPFIFEFEQGTELGFREIFLLASGLSVLSLASVLSNLDMEMDPSTQQFQTLTELVPLGLIAVVLLITFCPFNVIYRSSRFFLIRCAWHCVCAPLYKVTLSDFFLADQLTSQVQALRCIQFYICYYFLGDFTARSNKFLESNTYDIFHIIVAVIPFMSRALQCLRRLFEEKDSGHGLSSLKYFSTVVALVVRTMYDLRRGMVWKILAVASSGFTTVFNTYWDIVIDWGLLRKNAHNPWLRDKLLVSNKAVYYVAIVVNIVLRLVWMQLVLDIEEAPFLHRKAMIALVACLEIVRRGIWNFFRLENEHLNNVGKYRAFKSVPLPFHYSDHKKV